MEDLDDNISLTGFEPLFIKEEDTDPDRSLVEQRDCNNVQHRRILAGTQLNQSSLIKPYLEEMDDLLRGCEELSGLTFGSHFSEPKPTEGIQCHREGEVTMESYEETNLCPQAYLSTSYIDTNMDGSGTGDEPEHGRAEGLDRIINRCGVTSDVSQQREMPLTLAGNKLSNSMIEYEGQLLGMLAMLENCMEETGMDFEPQDWLTDATQEYVHISTNSNIRKGTTLVPIKQERLVNSETNPLQSESCAGQNAADNRASRDSRNEAAAGEHQTHLVLGCDNTNSLPMERLEGQRKSKTDLDDQYSFPESSDITQGYPVYCEATGCGLNDGTTATIGEISRTEEKREFPEVEGDKMDLNDPVSGSDELCRVGSQMEECIKEVQQLVKRRKELLSEVLELRGDKNKAEIEEGNKSEEETEEQIESKVAELMNILKKEKEGRQEERKKEIQCLWKERAEEEKRIWKVNLERQGLQEELGKLKRRLFAIAREYAHNQVSLNTQRREVDLLKREEEKMQTLILQLTKESTKLKEAHQQQVTELQTVLQAQSCSHPVNSQDMTQCKRNSCGDIQQYLQGGLKALEARYEPILLALLKRRGIAAEALNKAKQQAQELRAQLRPLQVELQKLILQRTCLEEKLKLTQLHQREDVDHYKERVYTLEDNSRELKTELEIQKRKTKEIKELRDSLTKRLLHYRAAIEDHSRGDEQKNKV